MATPSPDPDATAADVRMRKSAGFEPARLRAVSTRFISPAPFDTLRQWNGSYPGGDTPVRVEAASFHGVPTFFRVTGPPSSPVATDHA